MFDSILCGKCNKFRVRQSNSNPYPVNSCHFQGFHTYERVGEKEELMQTVSRCKKFGVRREEDETDSSNKL